MSIDQKVFAFLHVLGGGNISSGMNFLSGPKSRF
jgi:hypothetical protein